MNFRAFRSITASTLLLWPTAAFLQSGAVLQSDVDAWQQATTTSQQEESNQEGEALFQSQQELFPDSNADPDQSELDRLREERISEFVSVEMGNKLVVFRDVPRTAWFAPYVRDIAERGIVSGYADELGGPLGLFGPQDNVTVEQMVKVMLYASGRTTDACPQVPKNLTSSGSWSAVFVSCAEQWEWSQYSDGSVDVHRSATRGEVVATLLQAFDVQPQPLTGSGFTDVSATVQYGQAIQQAKENGIVSGYTDESGMPNGLFGPDDPVTRAEFAKIVTLGMQVYQEKD